MNDEGWECHDWPGKEHRETGKWLLSDGEYVVSQDAVKRFWIMTCEDDQ